MRSIHWAKGRVATFRGSLVTGLTNSIYTVYIKLHHRSCFNFFLGLETFSQLVYEDEYGAVSEVQER